MAKQMVKISQGRVRDKGTLWFPELVDKSKLLDCACKVYNNSELVVCFF